MSGSMTIISNNPRIFELQLPAWERIELSGCAREVLEAARDKIHLGWRLTHHPLYGNFRPHQQPFRTVILERENRARPGDCAPPAIDAYSLSLIEAAMGIYRDNKSITPDAAPPRLLRDCSMLDFELLRATLSLHGWSGQQ